MIPLALAAGGALLGGIAGAQGDKKRTGIEMQLAPESALEKQAGGVMGSSLTDFQNLIGLGPGGQDVTAGLNAQRNLAQLLGQYSQGGYQPTAQDYSQAQSMTNSVFAPQQQQMQQGFMDDEEQFKKMAAMMGRDPNDPVFRNKMMQQKQRAMAGLGAEQRSYFDQQAQNAPMQRLNFMSQLSQVQGGLASNALANKQALLAAGQSIKQQEQNFRLGTATKIGTETSGGGLAGSINGAVAGAGMFAGAAPALSSMFAGFSGGGAAPGGGGTGGGNKFSAM